MLVCAPSNIAVDNLLTKLAASNRVVRLGHPARINVNLQHLCLGQFYLDTPLKRDCENWVKFKFSKYCLLIYC